MRACETEERRAYVEAQTYRDLTHLMRIMLAPFEAFVPMGEREVDIFLGIHKALDRIKSGERVPDEIWQQLEAAMPGKGDRS